MIFNAELAEHAEKSWEFFSAGFAVSAFNVVFSDADWRQRDRFRALGRFWRPAEQDAQFVAFHHLDLEQPLRDELELVTVLRENLPRLIVRLGQDPLDLSVDLLRRVL